MTEEYTVNQISEGYYEDRKSEFYGVLTPTSTPDEFKEFTDSLRKEHREMCHFCSAFRIRNQILTEKASDDGEPSGTAGKPILGALQRKNLMNCGIVVYRKFGGTKLGTGGLVKAYGTAARLAIESAKIGQIIDMQGFSFSVDYSLWSKLEKEIRNYDSNPFLDYSDSVGISLFVTPDHIDQFLSSLKEMTAGKITPQKTEIKPVFRLAGGK